MTRILKQSFTTGVYRRTLAFAARFWGGSYRHGAAHFSVVVLNCERVDEAKQMSGTTNG